MRRLVALDLPGGPGFVAEFQRAWDDGDAVLPIDQRLPDPARSALLDDLAPSVVVDRFGERTQRAGGRPVDDGDALVVATSGSTGSPKGVVITHAAVEASAEATSARLGVTADDHWLACLPLSHVGGLSVVTRALLTGTRLTVHAGFDPVAAVGSGASLVSLVPTALGRIDARAFRTIVLGGSRPPADRPANTVTTYGMTETGSGVVYDGTPLGGVDIRTVDGEIQLRCPMLFRCYRDGTNPITADGWFPTGDLGTFDGVRLHVDGRRGDLIITGGENVWPEPVESVLKGIAGIEDAAVVGVDDREWGQVVTAYVVVSDPSRAPTVDQVRDAVKSRLPAFCAPRSVVVVDRLPRTALGKLVRPALGPRERKPPSAQ